MKIPKISEVMAKFAKSKMGQKAYKYILNPDKETFLNNTLPLIESAVCTGSYIYATASNKKIPEESKPILQWQNVLNGVIGIAVSGKMNKWVSKKGQGVIKGLKPELIKDFDNVVTGVKVGLPILMTSLIMRFGVSYLTVPMSAVAKKLDSWFRQDNKKTTNKVDKHKLNVVG